MLLTSAAACKSYQIVPVVFIHWKYIVVFGLTEFRIHLHFSGKLHEVYAVIQFSLGRI